MRETEPARGDQADSSPEVAEHAHELRVPRGNFAAGNVPPVGDGAAPISDQGPTASEQAYGDVSANMKLELALAELTNNRSEAALDHAVEIADMVKKIRAVVAKRDAMAKKVADLLPSIIAAVGADDETVLGPIKPELEGLGLYPEVVAAVTPIKHRTESKPSDQPPR